MKALDTNVLIRFLIADDPSQATKVKDLFIKAEENRLLFGLAPAGRAARVDV